MKIPREIYLNSIFLLKNFDTFPLDESVRWSILKDYFVYLKKNYVANWFQKLSWMFIFKKQKKENEFMYSIIISYMK